jgi:hypothetical protein
MRCRECEALTNGECPSCQMQKLKADNRDSMFPGIVRGQKYIDALLATPLRRMVITDAQGNPYLERIVIREDPLTKEGRVYLHIIYKSDDDRDMHDHPWDFQSTILKGSYINHMACGAVTYGEAQTLYMKAEDAHRLEVIDGPVVTLVHRGPKKREWGFHTIDGWVNHKDYLNAKFGHGNYEVMD